MRSHCVVLWWASVFVIAHGYEVPSDLGAYAKFRPSISRILQCQEGCLEKFAIRHSICLMRPECTTSGFPPYNYNSLPDALHLLCWDECGRPAPAKINKSILETWALHTVSMIPQGALVLVEVAWAPSSTPNQCLVTWEISGGGLMGNLLTESSGVELSVWPETKYRVQVTCKNKKTGAMSRSLPLIIDTVSANLTPQNEVEQVSTTTTPSPITTQPTTEEIPTTLSQDEAKYKEFHEFYENLAAKWNPSSNGDVTVSKIVPAGQPDFSSLPMATLSELQQPLLACAIGGAIVLAVVLSFYVWLWSAHSTPSDKKHLFEDENSSAICPSIGETNHFGSGVTHDCNTALDPNNYSRTVHVLTV